MAKQANNRFLFVLLGMLILGLTALYASQRDLRGRWDAYEASNARVDQTRQELSEREARLEAERKRAAGMSKDPVEQEATVRKINQGVRDKDIVFRMETPSNSGK